VSFASRPDAFLGSLFPNTTSRLTPSRSKLSHKFHHLAIYANCKGYKANPTFYTALSQTTPLARMVSSTYREHDVPFRWDKHAKTNFDVLKTNLSNAPLISPPDYDRDYILYLSASTVSVAGILVQLGDDGREHVIYYINKNLSNPPLKYNHDEKLSLAFVLAVQKLRHYIMLRTTKVIANSNPMQYLLSR
jgi:hypothetical protein